MRKFKVKKTNRVHNLHFTPDGQQLLLFTGVEASGADTALWLDVSTGQSVRTVSFPVDCFAIARDHSRIVAGRDAYNRASQPDLIQWCDPRQDVLNWQSIDIGASGSRGTSAIAIDSVALAPDGNRFLVGFGRQMGAAWTHHLADRRIDSPIVSPVINLDSQFLGLTFSPDGEHWAAIRRNNERPDINLFKEPDKPPLAQFVPRLWPGNLHFSSDGRYLAVPHHKSVFLLTADHLTRVAEFSGHGKQVKDVAFSPDSKQLMSVSNDGMIRVWDIATKELTQTFNWEIGQVSAIAYAPDGLTCAAAGQRGQIVIWDVE